MNSVSLGVLGVAMWLLFVCCSVAVLHLLPNKTTETRGKSVSVKINYI